MQLRGQAALVTGATGGIGNAIARALYERGARVLLSGRRQDALGELAASLGERAEVLVADLAERDAPTRLAEAAGAVDVLVANAALPASGRVEDFDHEQIDRALDVNLRAPIQLTRALLPGMLERGRGHVVFVSSLSGKVASPRSGIYSATKFGLRGFAAGLREDVEPSGIRVTVVFPGFVRDAGLFADSGVKLPPWVGTRTPEQVAEAVVRGIERERAELDVAPLGLRVGTRIAALAPVTVARLQRRLGSERIADALADAQRDKR
ncbi:MAG TPA: SDR family NAD(P)-dependent oxidoreductase [Thermoleophilaceae bacterium]|nr:SDR family NAD(P)-dependent oxidoreductase [Thermoleophilaceae bacterium]